MASDSLIPGRDEPPPLVVRYASHEDGMVDVFLPADHPGRTAPLVVLVHGGFWRQQWDRTHLRPLAWALAQNGFVVATPEYRRVGGLGGWPETAYDVRDAVRAVGPGVEQGAPGRIDVEAPFVLAGHSAGGHLALWAGLQAESGVIEHVVALAPVTNLIEAAKLHLDDGAAQDLLGGDPEAAAAAYQDADPRQFIPGLVPVTVIHGDQDQRVPVEMSRALSESVPATRTGASFRYVELPGTDHFALIDPSSPAFPTVVRSLQTG